MKFKLGRIVTTGIITLCMSGSLCFAEMTPKEMNEQSVMAITWLQSSAEYRAICYQAYNNIKAESEKKLKAYKPGDKKLAIVLDIDETILDNSPNGAKDIDTDKLYSSKSWHSWVSKARAEALPGAIDTLKWAAKNNIEIVYVSNRNEEQDRVGTEKNLNKYGLPNVDKKHLLLKNDDSNKKSRFEQAMQEYNVIMFVGDNIQDFPIDIYKKSLKQRDEIVDKHKAEFGSKFIILPNPRYGSWESALSEKYWGMTLEQRSMARKAVLKKEE